MNHKELADVSRKNFFRDSLNRNNKLRDKANNLYYLGWVCITLILVTIVVGMGKAYELCQEVSYISIYYAWLATIIVCSIKCFTLPAKLRREADALDYQLMAAFPDWSELCQGE